MSATETIRCDGCGEKLDPKYATNPSGPQSKMRITRCVYQFNNGYDDISQHYDLCARCMCAFYDWFEKWQKKKKAKTKKCTSSRTTH